MVSNMEEEKNREVNRTKVNNSVTSSDKSKNSKEETIIIDEKKRRIDVDTLLEYNKEDSVVQVINYLLNLDTKCIDKQFIVDSFNERAGNVVDENTALEVLKDVSRDAIEHINRNDEYLYIDVTTGRVDPQKSEEKARSNDGGTIGSDGKQDTIKEYLNSDKNSKDEKTEKKELKFFETQEHRQGKKRDIEDFFAKNEEKDEDIEKLNNTEVKEEFIGKELYDKYKNAIKRIKEHTINYDNQYSELEIKLLEYDANLRNAKNTPRFEEILNERNLFLKEHPELKEFIDSKTGLIEENAYKNYEEETKQYNDSLITATLVKQITIIKQIGFDSLDSTQKINAIKHLVAGLGVEELKEDVSKFLEEIIPGYKHSEDINNRFNREAIEKIMGYDKMLQVEGFEELIKAGYIDLLNKIDKRNFAKIDERNLKNNIQEVLTDGDIEQFIKTHSQEIDVAEFVVENAGTKEDQYFYGSKINFSKKDNNGFKYLYKKTSILSWLSDKDAALVRRYECLQYSKQELENSNLPYKIVEEKLKQINKEIENFERNNTKFNFREYVDIDGNLKQSHQLSPMVFSELRGISKLTKDFIEDEEKISSLADYKKLNNSEKEIYLRNSILALNQKYIPGKKVINEEVQSVLRKFGQRRLEIISSKEQPFLIDEDDIHINEEALLSAYNDVSPIKFKNYKDLVEYCRITRLEYTNEKLKLCEELDESSFQKLGVGTDEEKLDRIEQYKIANWDKAKFYSNIIGTIRGESTDEEIDKMELDSDLKARITELDKRIGQEDIIMMEFLRLQGQIEKSFGEEKKNAVIQRDSFIKQHPENAKDFLVYLNADNKNKIDINFELHKNAIVEKNTLLAIGTVNSLSDESLKALIDNEDLRRQYLLTLVAAFDGMLDDRYNELFQAIEKICPNTNFRTKDNTFSTNVEEISKLLGKELGIEECDTGKLMSLMFASKAVIVKNENVRRMENGRDVDFEDINVALNDKFVSNIFEYSEETDLSKNVRIDREEMYFKDSKMTYTASDAENFEKIYFESLSMSWIEKKEQVEKLYFTTLLLRREQLENKGSEKRKIDILDQKITEYEMNHPNVKREDFLENGKLKESYVRDYERYKEMKYTGDLISDYVLDESKVENTKDYDKMSEGEKKEYLQKTLFGVMEENNDIVYKLAKRRLEVISKSNRKLVRQNGDDIEIDNEAFYKELDKFYKLSSKNINNLDEFKDIFVSRKSALINVRLKEYSELSEDQFTGLDDKNHMSRAIKIEEMRERNKLKRSLETIILTKNPKSKGNVKRMEKIISEKTIILGEEVILGNRDSRPRDENTPRGIEISEIKVADTNEKAVENTNENFVESVSYNSNNEKTSILDRVKGIISTITKSQPENTEVVDKDEIVNEDGNLLPVEVNRSLLSNIANRIKRFFYKEESTPSAKEELTKQNQLEMQSDFDKRIRCDGKIGDALRITQENADKKNKTNGLEEGITQDNYDEDRVGV